jgi:hypothetical protein
MQEKTLEALTYEEKQKLVKGITERAQMMWMQGNAPNPRWWQERIEELIDYLIPTKV